MGKDKTPNPDLITVMYPIRFAERPGKLFTLSFSAQGSVGGAVPFYWSSLRHLMYFLSVKRMAMHNKIIGLGHFLKYIIGFGDDSKLNSKKVYF